jgi:anthranilate phosphoribosyltransferase
VDAEPAVVQRCLDETGWTFLFAPAFHASTRHAVGPRKELGVRTVFNFLGPLTNPALPVAQVVGVPRPELAEPLARCLGRLGLRRAWVVHGAGMDELSLSAPTEVAALSGQVVRSFTVTPEEAGLDRCAAEALKGGDAAENAAIARQVLAGEPGPRRDVVLLNAAAALLTAGRSESLREGVRLGREALDAGRARQLLDRVRGVLGG